MCKDSFIFRIIRKEQNGVYRVEGILGGGYTGWRVFRVEGILGGGYSGWRVYCFFASAQGRGINIGRELSDMLTTP